MSLAAEETTIKKGTEHIRRLGPHLGRAGGGNGTPLAPSWTLDPSGLTVDAGNSGFSDGTHAPQSVSGAAESFFTQTHTYTEVIKNDNI